MRARPPAVSPPRRRLKRPRQDPRTILANIVDDKRDALPVSPCTELTLGQKDVITTANSHLCSDMADGVKCASLNVNGLQAFYKAGHLKNFLLLHKPHILLLSEIRISAKKLHKLKPLHLMLAAFGFTFNHWNPSRKVLGLSGTAILSRLPPKHVFCGTADADKCADDEGRLITAVFDKFIVTNTYTPCSSWIDRKMSPKDAKKKDGERLAFDAVFRDHLSTLLSTGLPVLWAGDQNITASNDDVYDGHVNPRRELYATCKPWERDSHRATMALGVKDAYRCFNPTPSTLDFTYWRSNAMRATGRGLRLDHLLCSESLLRANAIPRVTEVRASQEVPGSDHCPLTWTLLLEEPERPPHADAPPDGSPMSIDTPDKDALLSSATGQRPDEDQFRFLESLCMEDHNDEFLRCISSSHEHAFDVQTARGAPPLPHHIAALGVAVS